MIKTILIADDSITARKIMRRCLEIVGFAEATFIDAADGVEAIDLAKSQNIDLLVSDVNMPNLGGVDLVRWMKGRPSTHDIPIVMVTSIANHSLETELLAMGVLAVVKKPLTPVHLYQVVAELQKTRSEPQGESR